MFTFEVNKKMLSKTFEKKIQFDKLPWNQVESLD